MKTPLTIANLNEDLDLFDESNWDFFDVATGDLNYEFYQDTFDLEFQKTQIGDYLKILYAFLGVVIFGVVFILGTMFINDYDTSDNYNDTLKLASVEEKEVKLKRVEGEYLDAKVIIPVSKIFSNYFGVLRQKEDFSYLDNYCLNSSAFGDLYESYTSKVEYSYDTNDCYARIFKEVASSCGIEQINDIVLKDGIYYCYMDLNVPSSDDIHEYIYNYSYNFTKYFQTAEVNEANIVKYLLQLTEISKLPTTSKEFCIQVVNDNGVWKIKDDSFLSTQCRTVYSAAIDNIANILGVGKIRK